MSEWILVAIIAYGFGVYGTYVVIGESDDNVGRFVFSLFWPFNLVAAGFVVAFVNLMRWL